MMRHEGRTLVIEPRTGSFPGMPTERAYTVEFLATDRPTGVTVDGRRPSNGTWTYDESARLVTVFLPSTPCSKSINVTLQ